MPDKKIDFDERGLAGILRGFRLVVPPNQREYAWKKKHVTTLFADLQKAIADENSEQYFLGTVVTIPLSNDLLAVVDGQQRLATTAILLAEIRNHLKDKEPLLSERITNLFLTDIDPDKRERVAKLTLNVDDNEFFRGMITAEIERDRPVGSVSSHTLIADAFEEAKKHVRRIVAGLETKDHGDVLNRWVKFLEFNAQVILLKVSNAANAYKMFETLNDRGLETSQADLVKNYLFEQAGTRLPEAQQKWARMKSALESLDDDDLTVKFLRQAMIVTRGYLKVDQVYEEVQKRVKGPQTTIQFLVSLENLAAVYVAMFNPDHEKWNAYPDAMRRAIQTLNLLNIRTLRPLMLAASSIFDSKNASEVFRLLISWGVRLIVASNTSQGSVEEPLANAGHHIFTGDLPTPSALKKQLSAIIPTNEQFKRAFEVATISKANIARYYLRSLEMAAKNETTPWFIPNDDRQTINLEHILPENPSDNWPSFDAESTRTHSKRIGNLALLLAKNNSDLRSDGFETKKAVYENSPYELTRQIAALSAWTPDEIESRQKVLAGLALRAWPL
ncbi:MAG: DUF262 domain-containing protein [Acidobacteriota bacterium]